MDISNNCVWNKAEDCTYCLAQFCSSRKQDPQTFTTSNTLNNTDKQNKS